MTREEAIDLLDNLIGMVDDNHDSDYDTAINMAIKALEQEPCDDTVSRGVFEQVVWERDTAIEQLHELGYELGQKIEPCDDCVSRQEAIHCVTETELYNETFAEAKMRIAELKPVLPKREQGEWIGDKAYPICPKCNCNIIEEYISCSDYAEMYKPMKYCPNCGAEMR